MKVEPIILEGRHVRLEPLAATHIERLGEAIEEGKLYDNPYTLVPYPRDLAAFVAAAEAALPAQRELAFATIDKTDGSVAGSTRFKSIDVTHLRAEIGFTFIRPSKQRTPVNTEAKYLMLRHAFETWGTNRVELLTDVQNRQSRTAIERIGGKEEGIMRAHLIMRSGRLRDSVIYSILRTEWPAVKAALEGRMKR